MAAARRLVSVVVPAHERPALLDQALSSVRAQVEVDLEVLVVDDGSQGTAIEQVAARHGARYLRHETARGVSAARNAGVAAATGHWVAFLDDDDLWSPGKLAAQLARLAEQPGRRWSATACVHVDHKLAITGALAMPAYTGPLHALLLQACWIPAGGSSVLVERSALSEAGGFVEGRSACEDWDMWLRLAEVSDVAYVDRPLVAYRTWGGNASRNIEAMRAGRDWVLDRHAGGGDAGHHTDEARWHQHLGRTHLLENRRMLAVADYLRAIRAGAGVGQLAYAASALLAPQLAIDRMGMLDGRVRPDWRAEADGWLGPVRAESHEQAVAARP